jgi:hypothetical protein
MESTARRSSELVRCVMDFDSKKLEEAVLGLLYFNSFDEKFGGKRAWKGFPWSVMDQLHAKGYISDPATKYKSVWLTEEGARLSKKLCEKLFAVKQRLAISEKQPD